ncbi:hypothetical protein [Bifidobacterium pullorum]|uniref:hypothetical protein n=1 Tax=Bifidobacterium pullorum TaxID=78448 RepID=UPI00307C991F
MTEQRKRVLSMAQNPDGGGYEIPLLTGSYSLEILAFALNEKMPYRSFCRLIDAFIRCKTVPSVPLIVPREVVLRLSVS